MPFGTGGWYATAAINRPGFQPCIEEAPKFACAHCALSQGDWRRKVKDGPGISLVVHHVEFDGWSSSLVVPPSGGLWLAKKSPAKTVTTNDELQDRKSTRLNSSHSQ